MAATARTLDSIETPGAVATAPLSDTAAIDAARPRRGPRWARRLHLGFSPILGLVALGIVLFAAVLGPTIASYEPLKPNPFATLSPPSSEHWFGTDQYGRDVFARVVSAARLDLMVAFAITLVALAVGAVIGGLSGFLGGIVDDVVMRVVEIIQSFPAFILAIGIAAMLGNETKYVIIAVAAAYTPYYVRIVRSEMLSLREAEYAAAAKCVGNSRLRVLGYHLLPNALPPALVQATLTLGWGILDTAGLSFLGVGIRPPTAEWGVLVSDGAQYINSGEWWISVFPGVAILLAVLGFNLVGEWIRDLVAKR